MNVYEVKKVLQHKPITDIPLRVVSYCRVSTKSLEQATSIENQVEHYRKKIQGIPAWTFVGEYVDNGISGTSVKARVQFNKMIEDAENGMFDLIVTKAVSRFARNTLRDAKASLRGRETWTIRFSRFAIRSDGWRS